MSEPLRTATGQALSDLVLDLFQVSNQMLASGDRLVAGLGLTSTRWQVLGSILAEDQAQPVAWLARNMGANRQNVQRIVNDLAADGLVAFETNPHHKRAQRVVVTKKGRESFDAAMRLQVPWINRLADGIRPEDLASMRRVLTALKHRLADEDER